MKFKQVPISLKDANQFVLDHHRHNLPCSGHKFSIGCVEVATGDLVGVAIVGRPIARLLDDGDTAEILRTCVLDGIRNANSFLYGCCWRAWRAMGGTKIITYTLPAEGGGSLRGAGFRVVAQTQPGSWERNGRPRNYQAIYGQQKFRWEKSAEKGEG